MLYICKICNYSCNKKYNITRHLNKIHKEDNIDDNIIIDNQITIDLEDKKDTTISFKENIEDVKIIPNKEYTDNDYKYVKDKKYKCDKCDKKYNTLEYYKNHIKDCNISYKIDNLTCPKCMKSFYSKDSKNRHIRNDKCKPCSINNPNPISNNIITNSYNTSTNTNNIANQTNNTNNITNNIYNNYNSERLDYITLEKFYEIIIKTLPICDYTLEKHFNRNFTENNNIRYSSKNKCFVRENNKWCCKNMNTFLKAHIDKTSFEIRNKFGANLDYINDKTKDIMRTNDLYFSLDNKNFTNRYYKDNIDTIKDYIINAPELRNII